MSEILTARVGAGVFVPTGVLVGRGIAVADSSGIAVGVLVGRGLGVADSSGIAVGVLVGRGITVADSSGVVAGVLVGLTVADSSGIAVGVLVGRGVAVTESGTCAPTLVLAGDGELVGEYVGVPKLFGSVPIVLQVSICTL